MSCYVCLSALQHLPLNSVNANEDGDPKTFVNGNVVRQVVSSQSWKRQMRLYVEQEREEPAARTRLLQVQVAQILRDRGWPEEEAVYAGRQVAVCASTGGLSTDPQQPDRTLAMVYINRTAPGELAALCESHRAALTEARLLEEQADQQTQDQADAAKPPKGGTRGRRTKKDDAAKAAKILPVRKVAEILNGRTASINIFGRFTAEIPGAHVDGALQLAPAFATHESALQPDFFIAKEDLAVPGDSAGAHLQTQYRATSTLYRYLTLNVTELARNTGSTKQAIALLPLITEAFYLTLPQAKRTSSAHHTVPALLHYTVRQGRPVSYADAFERPVQPSRGGYIEPSVQAFQDHVAAVTRMLGPRRAPLAHGHLHTGTEPLEHLGHAHPHLDDLIDAVVRAATDHTTTDAEHARPHGEPA